jgi:hypothetical protein
MKTEKSWDQRIKIWDEQIKSGLSAKVHDEILKLIAQERVPRVKRLAVAGILRRVGCFEQAIGLLYPIVRPSEKNPVAASPAEVVEYASNLIQSGCIYEGRSLLNLISAKAFPQRDLFLGFSYFSEWDYQSSVPLLERYVQSELISPYQKLIGEVNLFAALVASEKNDAAEVLRVHLKSELTVSQNLLLFANCCEIESQLLIHSKKFKESEAHLQKIEPLFKKLGAPYCFYIGKWYWVAKIGWAQDRNKNIEPQIKQFQKFRAQFNGDHFPEVARDCDRWLGYFLKDDSLLNQVYWGTPWLAYRTKIAKENPWFEPKRLKTIWPTPHLGTKAVLSAPLIWNTEILPMRFLQILFSDFYVRWSMGSFSSKLYPTEFYSPQFTPQKLKHVAFRARQFLKEQSIPIQINLKKNKWFLSSRRHFFLGVTKKTGNDFKGNWRMCDFILMCNKVWDQKNLWFCSSEMAHLLKMPQRTCLYYLQQGLKLKLFQKKGQLKTSRYRLIQS